MEDKKTGRPEMARRAAKAVNYSVGGLLFSGWFEAISHPRFRDDVTRRSFRVDFLAELSYQDS